MDQKNYNKLEDFILDDHFCAWILSAKTQHNDYWQNWMDQHPEALPTLQEAESLVQSLQFQKQNKFNAHIIEQDWLAVSGQIDKQTLEIIQKPVSRKVYAIAASILLLVSLSLVIALFSNREKTFKTPFGEIQSLELPDGSKVVMQANSSLRLKKKWNKDQLREVWLEGEAYFEVVPTQQSGSKAFVVHAGEMNIEVLGTQFIVINRNARKQVVLEEGKISLQIDNPNTRIYTDSLQSKEQASHSTILAPGELVGREKQQLHFTKKQVDTKLYTSWIQEKWRFQDTPITEIVQLIEDHYGLTCSFENEMIKEKLITGTVPSSDLGTLLKGLEQLFDVKIEKKDTQIIFRAKPG